MRDSDMTKQHLTTILLRDLGALQREVELYPDDATPWNSVAGLPNSGGTLVLHLVGNLRHFIGAILGGTGYVRDRKAEFSASNLSRAELVALVLTAKTEVAHTLETIDESALEGTYPVALAGLSLPSGLFLLHLATHLTYHLGQLDYHRRVSTGSEASAAAVALAELGT